MFFSFFKEKSNKDVLHMFFFFIFFAKQDVLVVLHMYINEKSKTHFESFISFPFKPIPKIPILPLHLRSPSNDGMVYRLTWSRK